MIKNNKNKQLSLYIHFPFCIKKCDYCDFLSFVGTKQVQEAYVQALKREILERGKEYKEYNVVTIFIGGGTPSSVPSAWIVEIVSLIKLHFRVNIDAEISIEINPATGGKESFLDYKQVGINRFSIGLQSADDETLKILGRAHSYADFLITYEEALEIGIDNINVDMMSALPNQTYEQYMRGLEKVLQLPIPPTHISAYSLIIEEETPFYERYGEDNEELPDEDEDRKMYQGTQDLLASWGYHRYEISNYAKVGFECKHNKVYWERGNYLGLGLGSASMVEHYRWKNTTDMKEYIESQQISLVIKEYARLKVEEEMEEFMFLGLRLMTGVSLLEFQEQFGVDMYQVYGKQLKQLKKQGLIYGEKKIQLTNLGIDLSNYVFSQFLVEYND